MHIYINTHTYIYITYLRVCMCPYKINSAPLVILSLVGESRAQSAPRGSTTLPQEMRASIV